MTVPPTAEACLDSFSLTSNVFVLGSLEPGVTVYNQQVRAHNLTWALNETARRPKRVAIVGGGIAGVTAAACLLSCDEHVEVTVFEARWDLCPLQQGADHRWLHPNIYSWPLPGSTAPSASLPILNWTAGRASDVVGSILRGFNGAIRSFGAHRLKVVLGTSHLRIFAESTSVEWIGLIAVEDGGFWRPSKRSGAKQKFDHVVLATGFGLEAAPAPFVANSYWRTEDLGQPSLRGERNVYVVSGYGDGALVDLCRLTIERFRSDLILDELFGQDLQTAERELNDAKAYEMDGAGLVTFLSQWQLAAKAQIQLAARVRKDTSVFLHLAGRSNNRSLIAAFEGRSSFLNRFLCYLLYRCGAFTPLFGPLEDAVADCGVLNDRVLCRHGADTASHLVMMFDDDAEHAERLKQIKEANSQLPRPCFPPGYFRPYSQEK